MQSRIKALERMEVMDVGEADDPRWKFEFPDPGTIGTPVLQILDVSFGYDPARPLFRGVNFGLDMESRVALVGPNGAGKSTLVKLILGELNAQEGHVARNAKLRTACEWLWRMAGAHGGYLLTRTPEHISPSAPLLPAPFSPAGQALLSTTLRSWT